MIFKTYLKLKWPNIFALKFYLLNESSNKETAKLYINMVSLCWKVFFEGGKNSMD